MIKRDISTIVPNELINYVSNGFDVVGDIAILKFFGKVDTKYKRIIARVLMDRNKHIKSVFEKYGKIEGEERVPKVKWIAGKRFGVTYHRENGCTFKVDIRNVFFTPRLGNERLRVANQVKSNEVVLDMFCGVGPYSILIAKRASEVYSIDINKYSIDLLRENIKLNKVSNVKVFNGDAKLIVPSFRKKFDRIIMNLPSDSEKFLNLAVKSLKPNGKIHLYKFVNMRDDKDLSEKLNMIKKHFNKKVRIEEFKCGEVAPNILRMCFDISLLS